MQKQQHEERTHRIVFTIALAMAEAEMHRITKEPAHMALTHPERKGNGKKRIGHPNCLLSIRIRKKLPCYSINQ